MLHITHHVYSRNATHLYRRRRRRTRKNGHAKLLPEEEGCEDKGEWTGPEVVLEPHLLF